MTLRQHSFLRDSRTLSIDGDRLSYAFHSFARSFSCDISLSDIRPRFDEYRQVAWSWLMVGVVALGFLAFHFESSVRLWDPVGGMFAIVYVGLGVYSIAVAWKRSGRFLILKSGGDDPRTIWIRRDCPSRQEVDAFIDHLRNAIKEKKAAEPVRSDNVV